MAQLFWSNSMSKKKPCQCCGQIFSITRNPGQGYCSQDDCQRTRKTNGAEVPGTTMRIIEVINAVLTSVGKQIILIIGSNIGPLTKSMFIGIANSSECVIEAQKYRNKPKRFLLQRATRCLRKTPFFQGIIGLFLNGAILQRATRYLSKST